MILPPEVEAPWERSLLTFTTETSAKGIEVGRKNEEGGGAVIGGKCELASNLTTGTRLHNQFSP